MIKFAILGYGVVGGGVAEVMAEQREKIARIVGEEVELKYILVRHDYPGDPNRDKLVTDFSVIEGDPEVAVVAEVIGGVGAAYDYTRRALMAGKSVVSSNKELVATHGAELNELAREKGVNYMFEGSVGGGIPLLRPLTQCLAANRIDEVFGILNGTTSLATSANDPILPIRLISEAAKKMNDKFEIKGGFMDGKVVHRECWNRPDRVLFFPRQRKIEKELQSFEKKEVETSVIGDLVKGKNAAPDLTVQQIAGIQRITKDTERVHRLFVTFPLQEAFGRSRHIQRRRDLQKILAG